MIDELIYGIAALGAYKLFRKPADGASPSQSTPGSQSAPPSTYNPGSYGSSVGTASAFAGAGSGSGDVVEKGARAAATPERVARIKAAWQGREIPGLNHIAFALFVGQRESGSNYRPLNRSAQSKGYPLGLNQLGFAGMYQVGALGLEEAGMIKPGRGGQGNIKCLTNQSNWTDKCPGGLEQFLNSPELQELAFAKFTNRNKIYIRSILSPGMPVEDLGGYLAAAHLKGHTGAKALARGEIRKDDNGASTAEYYRIGAKSQSV
jgi:hypothetical protein